MYSAKEKVVNSVMTLYITMLKAIEEVIGYYTRHICKYTRYKNPSRSSDASHVVSRFRNAMLMYPSHKGA